VLRDSYYTGRYGESFDYRFFSSLVIDGSKKGEQELRKGLQALHRSAHALNATYGEPTRRILTILLQRLVDRLVSSNFLDLNYLKNPGGVFELDDDEFLYKISSAVLASGDDVLKRIHNIVIQRVAPETKTINLAKMGFSRDTDVEEIRDKIACSLKIPSELVILFDPQFDDQIGYRMFGKKFSSYEDALKNSSFSKLTGLALDEKEATRSNEEILVFLIS
jgi:HD superfamily phosphohydrolase